MKIFKLVPNLSLGVKKYKKQEKRNCDEAFPEVFTVDREYERQWNNDGCHRLRKVRTEIGDRSEGQRLEAVKSRSEHVWKIEHYATDWHPRLENCTVSRW